MSDDIAAYIADLFSPEDDVLRAVRDAIGRAGMPPIAVVPETGRFLQVLLRAAGARRVLELGTLGGYSAICMARVLPADGRIISLEISPEHAAVARRQLEFAGVADRVDVRTGAALELLPALEGERFDAVFLDADKASLPAYFDWALRLLRPGGLVIADNTLRGGRVLDESDDDPDLRGIREFNRKLATDPRVTGLVVPIGDGVGVGVVRASDPR
ncbi:MAG: O-methyltransferase [Gemmatimonadaceae bacterium]